MTALKNIRIGTRDSQLALWQAGQVKRMLEDAGLNCELVPVKSDGDLDLVTPVYAMGVEGVFTKTLDASLLSNRVDIAVHSMKDVPTQLAAGIVQAAVLRRASYKDILVLKKEGTGMHIDEERAAVTIATGSVRRKAQWLSRYPADAIVPLRGNVQTRLQKLSDHEWFGAIFAAAGLERIGSRPGNAIDLDWMLPAPAQGAIMVVCREEDRELWASCAVMNDPVTALCVQQERDFLAALMGGCSTPISALAEYRDGNIVFKGNVFSVDGREKMEIEKVMSAEDREVQGLGAAAAKELLRSGADKIVARIRNPKA
jgi:hydroxymethylbilane synthase